MANEPAGPRENTKIPQERLNQIAGRKLASLSVPVRMPSSTEPLEGELPFTPGRLTHPISRTPILKARFRSVGHDHLRFSEPPLHLLPPILFYDADTLAPIEQRVVTALQQRVTAVMEVVMEVDSEATAVVPVEDLAVVTEEDLAVAMEEDSAVTAV